jgi:tetratricopeptide (TPR) repeat protein
VALFGRKKPVDGSDSGASGGGAKPPGGSDNGAPADDSGGKSDFTPEPAKARKWFEHARTAADSSNFEYALTCFANGLKFDPEDMAAHQNMYESAVRLHGRGGKPAAGRDIRAIEGPGAVEKFAAAEFAWMRDLTNAGAALKLIQTAVKAEQREFGRWFAPKLLNVLMKQKKPSKGDYLAAMASLTQVGAWEQALHCGSLALQLDPTDAALSAELKNISAQRAMDQGGYEEAAGQEGGFRKFVRDEEKQRELDEAESLSGAGSSEERNLLRAKKAYDENPVVPENIHRYAQLLKKPGTPEAEEQAYQVYMKGFRDTREYRFKMAASDIKLAQGERNVRALEERAAASPDDLEMREQLDAARRELLTYRGAEFAERESKYPTDRAIKFQRGEIEFALGNYDSAMAAFQQAKDEPKLRVRAGLALGQCFAAEGWHKEAVSEYKEAIEAIDATQKDRELDIRYHLMVSLIALAREERSIDLAKEALDICSSIARRDITFRDIRDRRKEIDTLVRELTG